MPLTHFRCPDKVELSTSDCLKACRMEDRCVTYPTLLTILGGQREWSGRPSTTQLLNGVMQEWLKALRDYTVAPKERAYALLGTAHHVLLAVPKGNWFSEGQLARMDSTVTGIADLLEPDDKNPGCYMLTDYKTYGSFKVVRILGLVKEKVPHPTDVYKTTGSWGKAGSPKMVNVFHADEAKVDMWEEELQLNYYRVLAERVGIKVSRMKMQVTVRDGGLQIAIDRGITEPLYHPIWVRQLPNKVVETYFEIKRQQLLHHITSELFPTPCDSRESWDGRRCQGYCDVWMHCPKGIELNKLNKE